MAEKEQTQKVLLLIDTMASGGAERQMSYLAIGLKNAGYDVRLVQFFDIEVFYARELSEVGITTEIHPEACKPWRRVKYIAREVRRWRPDAVIAYKEGCSMAACLARLFVKFRPIVSERNTTQTMTPHERLKFALYRLATWIVPNSASQGRFIARNFPHLSDKVRVISNMIDTDRFHPADLPTSVSREVPTIITVARIAPQKNVLNYLHALRILSNRGVQAHFLWYGNKKQYADYYAKVVALQHELGLDDYITFCDNSHQIADEYRRADYFCLPSSYEGFANVLCEAMACGLVCCASDVCDNPDILPRKERLFNPNDTADIADKLQALLAIDPAARRAEAADNAARIRSLCSEQSFIAKYLQLINAKSTASTEE